MGAVPPYNARFHVITELRDPSRWIVGLRGHFCACILWLRQMQLKMQRTRRALAERESLEVPPKCKTRTAARPEER